MSRALRLATTWFAFAAVLAVSQAEGQRTPVSIGREDPRQPRVRRRYLYERPAVSPWVGVDVGFGVPVANCQECTRNEGGPAFTGSVAAGATLFSRVTLAAERSAWNIIFLDPAQMARITMYSARVNSRRGLVAKGGYGKASYKRDTYLLIDDKPAWMAGVEYCVFGRIDGCGLLDYTQSETGSPAPLSAVHVTYRLFAVRVGFAIRAHLLPGKRITLAPRQPEARGR